MKKIVAAILILISTYNLAAQEWTDPLDSIVNDVTPRVNVMNLINWNRKIHLYQKDRIESNYIHRNNTNNPHSVTPAQIGMNSWAGTTSITTLGSVSSGVWMANVIMDAYISNGITLDNITQITARSHTDLQDVGSNTHAAIDAHIASGSNPHLVTSNQILPSQSGNALRPLSTDGSSAIWSALLGLDTLYFDDIKIYKRGGFVKIDGGGLLFDDSGLKGFWPASDGLLQLIIGGSSVINYEEDHVLFFQPIQIGSDDMTISQDNDTLEIVSSGKIRFTDEDGEYFIEDLEDGGGTYYAAGGIIIDEGDTIRIGGTVDDSTGITLGEEPFVIISGIDAVGDTLGVMFSSADGHSDMSITSNSGTAKGPGINVNTGNQNVTLWGGPDYEFKVEGGVGYTLKDVPNEETLYTLYYNPTTDEVTYGDVPEGGGGTSGDANDYLRSKDDVVNLLPVQIGRGIPGDSALIEADAYMLALDIVMPDSVAMDSIIARALDTCSIVAQLYWGDTLGVPQDSAWTAGLTITCNAAGSTYTSFTKNNKIPGNKPTWWKIKTAARKPDLLTIATCGHYLNGE